ncbi:MAG: radical SAM protein [Deltaproteobacteria bacterium]|nr:radical SAM protein [Deltaproteobacteria bacterium]
MLRRPVISWKIKKKIKEVLAKEKGTIHKDHGGRVSVCLVYPNTYSLGMTNLGFQSVYKLLNDIDDCVCERAFLPSAEELEEHERTSTPLLSYESQSPLQQFDIIAFSLPFEDDYLNIPTIFELAGLPALSCQRHGISPLIVGGGVATSLNPEPLADFMDLFLLGEGEGSLEQFIELFAKLKDNGLTKESLKEFDALAWAYVPSLYEFSFDGARITGVEARAGAKKKIKAYKNIKLDNFEIPQNFVFTPDTEFKDTCLMEIERGCGRGCRFCAAGFLYLPPRWRNFDKVADAVKKGIESTGKVGLIGTAVSEYPEIKEVVKTGVEESGIVTLSSLRLDKLDGDFINLLKEGGYKTITLAPEAGTERMRGIINKGITDAEIMESVRLIAEAGFVKVKLYFIIGLPFETDEDAEGIVELSKRIKKAMKKGELTLSVNPFVPKPFTPFQWSAFERIEVVEKRLSIIKKGVAKEHAIILKAMSAREAYAQAFISRADRRAGKIILEASKKGWKKALKDCGFAEEAVFSNRQKDEILPWDMIDHGVAKAYFWKEFQKGVEGQLTPPCDVPNCFRCGVCKPQYFT